MNKKTLKVGDVVCLKSGGLRMTASYFQNVDTIKTIDGHPYVMVWCDWFDSAGGKYGTYFSYDSLMLAPNTKAPQLVA